VAVVFGTRPEAIKMAPIVLALRSDPRFDPYVIVTGQHREMLDQVLQLFGIRPDADLDIIRPRQSLTSVTTRTLDGLAPLLTDDLAAVLVQGDTTTTMATALAAFYARIPTVHVEAGLRTGNRWSPYPEEMNRLLTTRLASLHLAPTWTARENLLREGIPAADIVVTGNTVIDALLWVAPRVPAFTDPRLTALEASGKRTVLVTTHRRESWGPRMAGVAHTLAEVAKDRDDLAFVLPMHRNPVVREVLEPVLGPRDNVVLTEPLDYGEFVRAMEMAEVLVTDSGGVQEEGPSLGKPVLVLRDSTERPEAVAAGTARLVGTDPVALRHWLLTLLDDPHAYRQMATAVNPYGDGQAAPRCVAALAGMLGMGDIVSQWALSS
jgi:UDP-N-acetylglucosamine 2-epimerase (non-hydrolysing)